MENETQKIRLIMGLCLMISLIFLGAFTPLYASAQTLVGDVIDASHEFSRYPLLNYSLDFYVDNSGNWLPWNWGRGVGNAVMIGLFYLTNVLWSLTVMLAYATGYVVQEAFNLDFISTTAEAIGQNIQILSGVSRSGINGGFFGGFLLIFILILGIYLAYVGLLKRETTKAFKAVLNFLMVFLVSSLVFVSAPTLIGNINDLSRDLSTEALRIGTSITMPNSNLQGHESTALIRDNLFSIQIIQPWKALQFGTTDVAEYRVENIRSHAQISSARQDAVENEVERRNNSNMSVEGLPSRLGTVIFLLLFNLGLSAFILLLSGMMIFSQVLFIVYAMFLPISFVLSMIPTFEGMSKKAVVNLFNVVMMRAGITLVVTVAFSIATMLYGLAGEAPLFMIMFLQITTFAGIYLNLGKIMGMFSLQSNDSQSMSKNMTRNVQRSISRGRRSVKRAVIGGLVGGRVASRVNKRNSQVNHGPLNSNSETRSASQTSSNKVSMGRKVGQSVGNVVDAPLRMVDKARQTVDEMKHVPTHLKYAALQGKRNIVEGIDDASKSFEETKGRHSQQRQNKRADRVRAQAMKQAVLNKEKSNLKDQQTQAVSERSLWNKVSSYPPQNEKLTKRQLQQRQQAARQAYEARKQQIQTTGSQKLSTQQLFKQQRAQLTKPQLRQRQQITREAYETRKQHLQPEGSQKYLSQEFFKQPRAQLTKLQLRQRQQATRKAYEARKQHLQSKGSQKYASQELYKQPRAQLTKPQLRQRQQATRKAYETRKQELKFKGNQIYSSQEIYKQPRTQLTKPQLRQRQQATRKAYEARKQHLQSKGNQIYSSQEIYKQPRTQLTKPQLRQRQKVTRKAYEARKQELQSKGNQKYSSQEIYKQPRTQLTKPQLRQRQQATRKAYEARKQHLQSKGNQKYLSQELYKQPRAQLTQPQLLQRQQQTRKARETRNQTLKKKSPERKSEEKLKQTRSSEKKYQLKGNKRKSTSKKMNLAKRSRTSSTSKRGEGGKQVGESFKEKIEYKNKRVKNTAKRMRPKRRKANLLRTVQSRKLPRRMGKR